MARPVEKAEFLKLDDPEFRALSAADKLRRESDQARMDRLMNIESPDLELLTGPSDILLTESVRPDRNPLIRAINWFNRTLDRFLLH